MGAELNAGTGKETTSVYARVIDQHVPEALDVPVKDAGVHRGRLLAGAGVQLCPHRVKDLVDLGRAILRAAFEQQVLDQV